MLEPTGAYTTSRAAALAGVPTRTLNYWVKTGLLTPSVSPERVRLWSFEDLVRLRMVEWLRSTKHVDGTQIKGAALPIIRAAIKQLRERKIAWWDADISPLRVSHEGRVLLVDGDQLTDVGGQTLLDGAFDPVAPFGDDAPLLGPDLLHPRETLRIRPGKLSGEPHVDNTRVETQALFALAGAGYQVSDILRLYSFLSEAQVNDALDLEHQLARNATLRAA